MNASDLDFMSDIADCLVAPQADKLFRAIMGWRDKWNPNPSYRDFRRLRSQWLVMKEMADVLASLGIDECSVIEFKKILDDGRFLDLTGAEIEYSKSSYLKGGSHQ